MATKGEVNLIMRLSGNVLTALNQIQSQLRNFSNTFRAGFNLNLGAQTANLLLSLPGQFKAIAKEIDNLKTTAENANVPVEAFQALSAVAARSNVDLNQLLTTITKIRSANQAFVEQDNGIVSAFTTLGIEGKKFVELPLALQLEELGRAYAQAGDDANAFAAITEILGEKAGPKLQGFLRELGTKGFASLSDEAKAAGQVLDQSAINALAGVNTQLDEMGKRIKNLVARFAEDFAPVAELFARIGNFILGLAERIEIAFKRVLRAIGALVEVALSDLTLAQANEMLEKAAAEDIERKSAPVLPGGPQESPTPNRQRLLANQRSRELTETETAELRSLTERGKVISDETGFRLAAISRDFSLSAEQRRKATSTVLRAELNDISQLQRDLDFILATIEEGDPRRAAFERARDRTSDQRTRTTQELLNANSAPQGLGEGVQAGYASFVSDLGTTGTQVAATLQSTLGTTVQGISDSIYGWVIGARDFTAVWQGVGLSILKQGLDTVIQIGIQQVVNGNAARAIALGWKALTSGLRAADTAETIAAESAKTPVLVTNAAAASASSFGLSAVIGIAALAAALGAFLAGFEKGGYTGDGGSSQPAGVVHRGEYVFSAKSVRSLGLGRLEALHNAGRGYMDGGFVGNESIQTSPSSGGSSSRPIVLVDSDRSANRISRNSPAEADVIRIMVENRDLWASQLSI